MTKMKGFLFPPLFTSCWNSSIASISPFVFKSSDMKLQEVYIVVALLKKSSDIKNFGPEYKVI